MKASLKNYRQSPRKVRLVGNLIKGKSVDAAEIELQHMPKRASVQMDKLLKSAISNAKENLKTDKSTLFVKNVEVNKGVTLKRSRARARGSAFPINKRTSNILLTLEEVEPSKKTETIKTDTSKKEAEKAPVAKMEKKEEKTAVKADAPVKKKANPPAGGKK
ncbi:50S ribosomal protein L22 [Candidatus Wolfebacteria bacterium]|nr:MAG: 50S ribosomal protein L22 [Candidatus Wolfebacteria bacterium]